MKQGKPLPEHVLVADDDIELCVLLDEFLRQEGFDVSLAHDGEAALRQVDDVAPDVLILDIMMPRLNGIDVLKTLRRDSSLPVIMLTARGDDLDRILGLELGADDYLPKPCNPRELVARIRAVLRRSRNQAAPSRVRVGDVEIDTGTRECWLDGRRLELTSTEFSVLSLLLQHAGAPVAKRDLYLAALGREPVRHDRSIDMHVSNVRRKLGRTPDQGNRIETVRGLGYQFCIPAEPGGS